MAAGIGGNTVAEAKEKLSWDEVQLWSRFVEERGPLSVGSRLDVGLARLMLMVAKALGGDKCTATIDTFLPSYYRSAKAEEDGEEEELTLEGMYTLF